LVMSGCVRAGTACTEAVSTLRRSKRWKKTSRNDGGWVTIPSDGCSFVYHSLSSVFTDDLEHVDGIANVAERRCG
jgi:hypothetical protein